MRKLKTLLVVIGINTLLAASLVTHYYGYIFYMLFGVLTYCIAQRTGRHVYLLLIFFIFAVEPVVWGHFFLMDYHNAYGLNPLKIHPLTVSWVVIFGIELVQLFRSKKIRYDLPSITAILVLLVFFALTVFKRGMNGMPLFIENYFGPVTFFLILHQSAEPNPGLTNKAVRFMLMYGLILGFFGITEYLSQYNVLNDIYRTASWLGSTFSEGYRIKTVVGHPLNNALFFLLMSLLSTAFCQNTFIKNALRVFFTVVILLTGSRSIFALSLIVFFIDISKQSVTLQRSHRAIMLSTTGLVAVIALTLSSPLGSTLVTRMSSGEHSAMTRVWILQEFVHSLNTLTVRGLGASADTITVFDDNNNEIIQENPWIILFFDLSYASLLYIILILLIIKRSPFKPGILLFLAALSGYNSFGVKTPVNYALYLLVVAVGMAHTIEEKGEVSCQNTFAYST